MSVSLLFCTGTKPARYNLFTRIYDLSEQETANQNLSFIFKVNCFLIGHAVICAPQQAKRLLLYLFFFADLLFLSK